MTKGKIEALLIELHDKIGKLDATEPRLYAMDILRGLIPEVSELERGATERSGVKERSDLWIPVSERLPEEHECDRTPSGNRVFLVMTPSGVPFVAAYEGEDWYVFSTKQRIAKVTKWMVFPFPDSESPS